MSRRTAWLTLLLLLAAPAALAAFGQNKVNWRPGEWRTLHTAHFAVHHDVSLAPLARRVADMAERQAARCAAILRRELSQTIPILLYPSHAAFEGNRTTPYPVDEGTAAFTEFLKFRVVIPYDGSEARLYRVLAHELGHAAALDAIYGRVGSPFGRMFVSVPPLWFLEGLAEYLSIGWDAQSEAVLRDAVLGGTLPTMADLNDGNIHPSKHFLFYKQGQAFLHWLARRHGEEVIPRLVIHFRSGSDARLALQRVCGKSLEELGRDFDRDLKARYWPAVSAYQHLDGLATRRTAQGRDGSTMNVQPVWSADGKRLAYLSNKALYPALFVLDLATGTTGGPIGMAWKGDDYAGLPLDRQGLAWSPVTPLLAFVSRRAGRDVVYLHDTVRDAPAGRLEPPGDELCDPAFSPDGRTLALVGTRAGTCGLWLCPLDGSAPRRIREGRLPLSSPRWLAPRRLLLLAPTSPADPAPRVHELDLDNPGELRPYPAAAAFSNVMRLDARAGALLLVVEDAGGRDLWLVPAGARTPQRLTRLPGMVGEAVLSPDGRQVAFSSYGGHGHDIAVVPVDALRKDLAARPVPGLAPYAAGRLAGEAPVLDSFRQPLVLSGHVPYDPVMRLDLVNGIIGFNSQAGLRLVGQAALSDMLGERQLSLLVDVAVATRRTEGDVSRLNVLASYTLLRDRLELDFGLFHVGESMLVWDVEALLNSAFEPVLTMRRAGAYLKATYPFSRFSRLDATWTSSRLERFFFEADGVRGANVHALELAFTFDNTVWSPFGPMDGTRFRVFAENAFDLPGVDWKYQRLGADYRGYLLFARRYALAWRAAAGTTLGRDRAWARYELGGFDTVRGYPFYSIRGESMFLANLELRFPFIDFLALGFPLPLALGGIRGVLFCDVAAAWDTGTRLRLWERGAAGTALKDLKATVGFGLRILLGPLRIRWDFAAPWDGNVVPPPGKWRGLFSLGLDF